MNSSRKLQNGSSLESLNGAVDKTNEIEETDGVRHAAIEMKCALIQNCQLVHQQKENLEGFNKELGELREKLEREKNEVHETLKELKEIAFIEKRYKIEKEAEKLATDSDEHLLQCIDQVMNVVKHGKNKMELKNLSFIASDQFKELLLKAESSIKTFNEGQDLETVQRVASLLPELEESLEKCNESNQKCAEIAESIERLLLHRDTEKSIIGLCNN